MNWYTLDSAEAKNFLALPQFGFLVSLLSGTFKNCVKLDSDFKDSTSEDWRSVVADDIFTCFSLEMSLLWRSASLCSMLSFAMLLYWSLLTVWHYKCCYLWLEWLMSRVVHQAWLDIAQHTHCICQSFYPSFIWLIEQKLSRKKSLFSLENDHQCL